MIVFDLSCDQGHRFEGWFGSSADFENQQDRGLVACPQCSSVVVSKAPMAPAIPAKGNQGAGTPSPQQDHAPPAPSGEGEAGKPMANGPMPPQVQKAMKKLAEAQSKALKDSKWVGNEFANASRAMHYGERDAEPIHGETSVDEAKKLIDEGIEVAPLPFPVTPPEDLN